MRHDFHEVPFGPSTLVKLALFEGYLAKWLPVFLHLAPQPSQINVVDFFSGPGEDVEHTPGSPLLLLKQLSIFKNSLGPWYGKINVILNDADQEKTERLEALLAEKFGDVAQYVRVQVHCKEFADLYAELLPGLSEPTAANLLFVDQTGVRELGDDTFRSIGAAFTCTEARSRAEEVKGGSCGFNGNCGAALGTGIFVSLVTGATPLSRVEWRLANLMTSESFRSIAERGGPRCCKRDVFLALQTAVAFLLKEACPFFRSLVLRDGEK